MDNASVGQRSVVGVSGQAFVLDDGPGPAPVHRAPCAAHKLQKLCSSAQQFWNILRAHPAVAVVPLLVFSVFTAMGFVVVYIFALNEEHAQRNTATNTAMQAAKALQLQLLSMAQPVVAMAAFLSGGLGMNYTQVHEMFPKVAATLLAQVASPSKDMALTVQSQGTITDVFPQDRPDPEYGMDTLAPPNQHEVLGIMHRPTAVTIIGPYQFLDPEMQQLGIMVASLPVFISGVEQDFNFSSPWPVSPFCPPALCWQEATKTKFWGLVSGTWLLPDLLRDNEPLSRLKNDGFRFVLKQAAANASMPATAGYGDYVLITRSDNGDVEDPVDVPVDLTTAFSYQAAPWVLSVSPESGRENSWEIPMYVVVAVSSLVISLLLMALMISRVEHQDLLFNLVPKDVIKQLKDSGALSSAPTRATQAIPAGSTPAEVLLGLLTDCLLGNLPRPAVVVQLRATLLSLQDIYRPAGVSQELRDACLDEDVANNLANLLTDDSPWNRAGTIHQRSSDLASSANVTNSNALFEDLETSLAMLMAGQAMTSCHPDQLRRRPSSPSLTGIPPDLPKGLLCLQSTTFGRLSAPDLSGAASQVAGHSLPLPAPITKLQLAAAYSDKALPAAARSCVVSMNRVVQDQLLSMLGHAYSSWTFDAFALDSASQGHSLSTLGFYLMETTGLMQHFKLPRVKVARFFQALEASYIDNPYHSRTHAADVLQTLHVILTKGGFLDSYVDPARHLACILAAAAHDVEHVGLTNDFLCNSEDLLALRYNDHSPSENHHLAMLFTLLRLPNHNFMKHLSKETKDVVRKVAIEVVMSTDMKQHMTLVSQFKSVHANRASRSAAAAQSSDEPLIVGTGPMFIDETERLLSLQVALKVADLGHLAETLQVHLMWVAALEDEFFMQGDREREAGMPITPLFDRNKPGVTKSQVGFYEFVAMPLFNSFAGVFTDVQPLVDGALENLRYWKQK